MKITKVKPGSPATTFLALALCSTLGLQLSASAQGTGFTYQGRLSDNGGQANGTYDLRFYLRDSVLAGNPMGTTNTVAPVSVSNGLFTVALDFGGNIFNGGARWLEIGVRTNGSVGTYTVLSPRQALTSTPYAIFAGAAGNVTNGAIANSQLAANAVSAANLQANSVNASNIASSQVVKSLNGLKDSITLAAGSNITLTTNGNTIQMSAPAGGLALPYSGSASNSGSLFTLNNAGTGPAVRGENVAGTGVFGAGYFGVYGETLGIAYGRGVFGQANGGENSFGGLFRYGADGNYSAYLGGNGIAGSFYGPVFISGPLTADSFSGQGFGLINIQATNLAGIIPDTRLSTNVLRLQGTNALQVGRVLFTIDTCLLQGPLVTYDRIGSCALRLAFADAGSEKWQLVEDSADDFHIRSADGAERIVLPQTSGDVLLVPGDAGKVGIGTTTPQTALDVHGEIRTCVLTIIGGCDISEPFHLSSEAVPKGAIVVIDEDHPGQLKLSDRPYDTRVAGIVSGANGINPGISLRQEGKLEGGENVALSGRVYALADASHAAIKPGDLLTTSSTPAHCMKVTDQTRAQGTVVGKAMSSLEHGTGMVMVLLTLQ